MKRFSQSPTDPNFVQDPYQFYEQARAAGDLIWWEDYHMPAAVSHAAVHALLRDRRFGRERLSPRDVPPHLARWDAVEKHSLLDAEPPRHTRLRKLVLRAFTSRRINAMATEIEHLCHDLIDSFEDNQVDLLATYCTTIPVTIIARLLGVPEQMSTQLLSWSHAMVAMYQASKTRDTEDTADQASADFAAFLSDYIDARRRAPRDDLLSELIAAEQAGDKLTTEELIGTCVLLLNAGHEATVHGLGNGIKALLEHNAPRAALVADAMPNTVEEVLRFDPPLHIFTRFAYEDVDAFGHTFRRGDEVSLVLGSAGRDAALGEHPGQFDPTRPARQHLALGGGLHFCVGAPLARLELQIGLRVLFERLPNLALQGVPQFANTYHFHGLTALNVRQT